MGLFGVTVDDVEKRVQQLREYTYKRTPYDLSKLKTKDERLYENLVRIGHKIQGDCLKLLADTSLPHNDLLRVERVLTDVSAFWQRLGFKK